MSLFTTRPHSHSLSPSSPFSAFPLPSDFTPMFKLMDDYASHVARRPTNAASNSTNNNNNDSSSSLWSTALPTFTPKFDVREEPDKYVLEGELPGIEQKDISIEFSGEGNGQTIVVRGRVERVREEGSVSDEGEGQAPAASQGEGYHRPSVQDEDADADAKMSGGNPDAAADGSADETAVQTTRSPGGEVANKGKKEPAARYWISERSVGEFSRSFAFPVRVDQDNVRASLRNGVLSVVVPKAAQRGVKRIEIE